MTTPVASDPASPLYDLRGVFDPGINGMVAHALKVPHGWRMQQSFTRQWNGAVPNVQLYLSLSSPDGRSQIDFLPSASYQYSELPATQRTQRMMAQQGQADPHFLAPLLPLDYLKRVLLPLLARQANLHLQITDESATAPTPAGEPVSPGGPIAQNAAGYVEGALPSGRRMRVSTTLAVLTGYMSGYLLQTWVAMNRIVQSDADLAACVALAEAVQQSVVINPAWQAQNQQLQQRGMQINQQQAQANLQGTIRQGQANLDASQRRFEQNVQMQEARRQSIKSNYENHRHAASQASGAFADYMGDRAMYENTHTGERVKVQGSFAHVYQDATEGTNFLGTNAPLDPNCVNWQELQQVELRNY